ncbi:AraC family transcriptional regulator [Cytophagaceae bacterium DM2B3-1]|uniref:AraC family transcriptional regulator n=1 Tax=Xanthocytophaga flava TaxID=3048013 RepID=A0ABT7CR80_9BACT|nr:AraC family transcriptional regulator [Xanthocytophaga flavus]MDJ1496227.1 AraC family transcriptional regulator [Xanthocytophaga flavus]
MRDIAKDKQSSILKEQFIPDHVFFYIIKGEISFFDGNRRYTFKAGECGMAQRNRLAKYILSDSIEEFEPIIVCFEEAFLQQFEKKHKKLKTTTGKTNDGFVKIQTTELIHSFIHSLKPYYKDVMQLDEAFEELKSEELLLILLRDQPKLADILFDYSIPEKINLEAFMNRNFMFNVSIQRFAYMTGRSLSAFKRDFKKIYNETPNRWLIQKRLQEAYLLLDTKKRKPSDIYLELGFETLAHFSYAFKKRFGHAPSKLTESR